MPSVMARALKPTRNRPGVDQEELGGLGSRSSGENSTLSCDQQTQNEQFLSCDAPLAAPGHWLDQDDD